MYIWAIIRINHLGISVRLDQPFRFEPFSPDLELSNLFNGEKLEDERMKSEHQLSERRKAVELQELYPRDDRAYLLAQVDLAVALGWLGQEGYEEANDILKKMYPMAVKLSRPDWDG
jgi:hypothetical protein